MFVGGKTKDVGPTMLTDGTTNIIKAMKKMSSTKRVAVVTSIGGNTLHVCIYVCIYVFMYVSFI